MVIITEITFEQLTIKNDNALNFYGWNTDLQQYNS